MSRTILITGAGSGFGEGTAIRLAKQGHTVIAAAQSWPQVTALCNEAGALGLSGLRVEKLDLLETHDTARVVGWQFDVLVNNAGVGEGGPISETPMDLVRRNFEVNVFAPVGLTQRVVKRWVRSTTRGQDHLCVVGPWRNQSPDGRRVFGHQVCCACNRRSHAG
jgi:NAD(P)-dependent dehydrogenase (short-subunit alcohol dehydrogenase family)